MCTLVDYVKISEGCENQKHPKIKESEKLHRQLAMQALARGSDVPLALVMHVYDLIQTVRSLTEN